MTRYGRTYQGTREYPPYRVIWPEFSLCSEFLSSPGQNPESSWIDPQVSFCLWTLRKEAREFWRDPKKAP